MNELTEFIGKKVEVIVFCQDDHTITKVEKNGIFLKKTHNVIFLSKQYIVGVEEL